MEFGALAGLQGRDGQAVWGAIHALARRSTSRPSGCPTSKRAKSSASESTPPSLPSNSWQINRRSTTLIFMLVSTGACEGLLLFKDGGTFSIYNDNVR